MEINDIKNSLNAIPFSRPLKIIMFEDSITEADFYNFVKAQSFSYEVTEQIDFIVKNFIGWLKGSSFQKIDPTTRKVVEATEADRQRGFWIAGKTGTGKTTLLQLMFAFVKERKIKYRYKGTIYNLAPIEVSEAKINREYAKSGNFSHIQRCSIYIDDIGADPKKVYNLQNSYDPIKEIVTYRYDDLKCSFNFFSSNYPISHEKIREFYGERVQDRLQAMCNYYELTGKNFRYD